MTAIILDYETYYAKDYSLSKMTTQSYIQDPRFKVHGAGIKVGNGPSVWVPAKALPAVFAKLDLQHNTLVGHNLQFDGAILAWKYGIIPKRYIDTLSLSRALIGQKSPRHGLTYIAELLCGLKKYEGFLQETLGVRDLSHEVEKRLAKYCAGPIEGDRAGDVMLTWEILRKMLPHISKSELDYMDWAIRIFCCPKVYLNTEALEGYHAEVIQTKENALESVGLTSREMLMSNEKFAEALRQLGVTPPTKLNAKGKEAYAFAKTDEGLKDLLEHEDVRVQALVAARLEVKSTIEETRAARYIEASRYGAWPLHINASGAQNTHRASGGMGAGGNPQNMKRGGTLRDCIYAPDGKVILVPDASQIECRITLWLGSQMPDANMEFEALEKLRLGEDIYSWFASHIYGIEISKKTHPLERQVAKSAVLGLGFGMGVDRFIEYCKSMGINDMTRELAERIVNLYRSMFRGVAAFWKYCQTKVLPAMLDGSRELDIEPVFMGHSLHTDHDPLFGTPSIVLPGGLRIKYPGLERGEGGWKYKDGNTWAKLFGGKVMENVVQALAARLLREIVIELNEPDVIDVWMTCHDEAPCLVDDTPDARAYAERRVVELFTRDVPYMPGLPLGVEYGFGYTYGSAKS